MESTLKAWQASPYSWALLALITVASLILAVYYGVKSNKYQRITYTKKTNTLISLKNVAVKSLHVLFNEEEITDVTITRIAVWNSGNEKINAADIVNSEPLRVYVQEGREDTTKILDCSIDYETDKSIFGNFDLKELNPACNSCEIPFDYLAIADGMIVQVIHTGEADDIYMDCHIKGGKETTEVSYDGLSKIQKKSKKGAFKYFLKWLLLCVPLAVLCAAIFSILLSPPVVDALGDGVVNILGFLTLFSYAFCCAFVILSPFMIKIPKKLKKKL